jgi:hypothetical protein
MDQTILGLGVLDWAVIIAGLLFVIIVLLLLTGFRDGRKSNIHIGGDNHGPINASDQSQRKTIISPIITIKTTNSSGRPPPVKAHSKQSTQDGEQMIMITVFAILVILTPLYIRFFVPTVTFTRLLYLFTIGANVALLGFSFTGAFKRVSNAFALGSRFIALLFISAAWAWFLLDSQKLIDPQLVAWVQTLPLTSNSIILFFKVIYKANLLWQTVVAAVVCTFSIGAAVMNIRLIYRTGMAGVIAKSSGTPDIVNNVIPDWASITMPAILLAPLLAFWVLELHQPLY